MALLRIFLLAIVLWLGYSSPELRSSTAHALRSMANWVEPKSAEGKNPQHFQIPNPFYFDDE